MPRLYALPGSRLDFLRARRASSMPRILSMEASMADYFASDRRTRRSNPYRFGRVQHGRGRTALFHVNGYLKDLIEQIASAKLRRKEREFAARGSSFDVPEQVLAAGTGPQA